jgi:short-subunit dehydrogenase involved in D-alanine esterification of teichoic acids
MTTQTYSSIHQKVARRTLSVPVQSGLYVSLLALILWTVYFTTYPAIHDKTHSLRHHTALVSCH